MSGKKCNVWKLLLLLVTKWWIVFILIVHKMNRIYKFLFTNKCFASMISALLKKLNIVMGGKCMVMVQSKKARYSNWIYESSYRCTMHNLCTFVLKKIWMTRKNLNVWKKFWKNSKIVFILYFLVLLKLHQYNMFIWKWRM